MQKKSGRNILTRLLPAFFILLSLCNGNVLAFTPMVWADYVSANPEDAANYSIGSTAYSSFPSLPADTAACNVVFNVRDSSRLLSINGVFPPTAVFLCHTRADMNRLCRELVTWISFTYPGAAVTASRGSGFPICSDLGLSIYMTYPSADLGRLCSELDAWTFANSDPFTINTGASLICSNSRYTVYWFYRYIEGFVFFFLDPSDVLTDLGCLPGCLKALAAAKASIIAEAKPLLSAVTTSPGTLPCFGTDLPYFKDGTFCLSGKEEFFQPFSNGVLFLGTIVSGFIVIRKKKPKK